MRCPGEEVAEQILRKDANLALDAIIEEQTR